MTVRSWIRSLFGRKASPIAARPLTRRRAHPALEGLEERTLLAAALGVTFDAGNGPLPELAVQSYSWGAADTPVRGVSTLQLQNFTLTLAPGSVEPGLWGQLAAGSNLKSATLHVRQPVAGTETEYLTYTLTDVLITGFTTADNGSGAPQDTVKLQFGEVAESYSPVNPDGTLGTANAADYDAATNTSVGTGSLAGPALAAAPVVGLSLAGNNELAVQSYSWGATNSVNLSSGFGGAGSGTPNVQTFTVSLAPGSVEPALWGQLAAGASLSSAVLHLRQAAGGGAGAECATYTLTNVSITSFSTGTDGSGAPVDTIQLKFGEVAESYSPINPEGSLGTANTADYDVATNTSVGAGSLAGPALAAAPVVGLSLAGNNELAVQSYSWGATNSVTIGSASGDAGVGKPSMQTFTVSLAPGSVEPALWGQLAAGASMSSAVLHLRQAATDGSAGAEYATFTLTNVFITSFSTGTDGSGAPVDTIQLAFGEVAESYATQRTDGTSGLPNTADYDITTNTSGGAGSLVVPTSTAPPQVGLAFNENSPPVGTRPVQELAVQSYSWGVTTSVSDLSAVGGVVSKPSVQTFTVSLAQTSVEPALWGQLAIGTKVDSVNLNLRKTDSTVVYASYTLTDVYITSFSTGTDGSGAIVDTIQLTFREVAESYTPQNTDGTLGHANQADYDVVTNTSVSAGSLNGPGPFGPPEIGLTLAGNPELEVQSYSWGATNPVAPGGGVPGTPEVQTVTLTLPASFVEPALWQRVAVGTHLASAVINVRKDQGITESEYATYTLTNVWITSFTTEDNGDLEISEDTIQLTFGEVAESYSPVNRDGSLGTANTADYDVATNTSVGAGSLAGPALAAAPVVGLSLAGNNELAVQSYSWGATNPAGATPSLQAFTLTLAPGSVEPALWGQLAAGVQLDSATIHVRQALAGGRAGAEYATFTLTDVFITSFSTGDESNDTPVDTIQLAFGEVAESYSPVNPDGSLGTANTADYDVATNTSVSAGSLGTIATTTTTTLTTSPGSASYGEPVVFTAVVAAAAGTPTGVVDFFDGNTDISGPISLTTVNGQQTATFTPAALPAGTHTITASFSDSTDVFSASSSTTTLVVAQATPMVTWPTQAHITYGTALGSTQLDATASAVVNGSTVSVPGTWTYTPAAGTVLGAGSYTLSVTFTPTDTADYTPASASVTLVVDQATLTITPATGQSKGYGAAVPVLTYSAGGFVNGDSATLLSGALGTTATASSPVGSYAFTLGTLTAGNNYTLALSSSPPTFAVTPATLTVTGSGTQVYGGSPIFSASYGGFVLGQDASVLGGTLAFNTTTTSSSQAGTYTGAVTPSGLTSSNYAISFVAGNMVVTPATLTVTGSGTQVYGGSPIFSASYGGFVLGQNASVLGGTLAFNTTTTSSSQAGTYTGAVTPSGLTSSNYAISFVAGNMVVTPATLTVTGSGTQVYGGSPTFSASYSGFVLGQNASVLGGTLAFGTTTTSSSNVGTYTGAVTPSGLTSSNYAISFVAGNMVVTPATLTVTGSGTQVYGGSPTFSASYSGFVLGQNASVLGGTLAFNTTTTSSSNVGTYTGAVTPSGLTSSNYAISFVAGNMVVTPATPTISWSNPAPIAFFTPLSATQLDAAARWTVGGNPVNVTGTFSYTPPARTLLAAGTQTLSASFTPSDSTDYTTATATIQIIVLGPGITVIGTHLYCVGGNATNDQVQINPAGTSNTGSTGVHVQGQLNGVNIQATYCQSFTTINVLLQGGNDNVQFASTLTVNAVVTVGNGNDQIQLGNGNNTVIVGNGNDQIQLGNGTNVVVAGNGNDLIQTQNGNGNDSVTVGNGNDLIQLGNGTNTVIAGSGNDLIQLGNGTNTVTAGTAGSTGNIQVQLGNGVNNSVTLLGNGNHQVNHG